MNKKGDMDSLKLVAGALLILIILGVLLSFVFKGSEGGRSFMNIMQGSLEDYDGDGIPDAKDECPCGSPENQQNVKEHIDGVAKCVQIYDEACSEKYIEYGFETITTQRGRTACVYHRSQCMKLIEDERKK